MPQLPAASTRRNFLGHLGLIAAAPALLAQPLPPAAGEWDMSWTDLLDKTRYKAVFDSTQLADGAAPAMAADVWNGFKDAYGTDNDTRMVFVMRQGGQVMAFNDALWAKYGIGEEKKVNDPITKQPAKRNPYASADPGEESWALPSKLDALHKRGAIFLVCNRAAMNWARNAAERTRTPADQVMAEVRTNLVPGAILMPTGIFALARAQNAGCAYMKPA